MKNILKLVSTIFLCISLFLSSSVIAFAGTNDFVNTEALILTDTVNDETFNYARRILPLHLNALIESGEISDNSYSLAQPLSIYDIDTFSCSYAFPILSNGNISAILMIHQDSSDEFSSSLSTSFSKELEMLLTHGNGKYLLLTDGNELLAYNGNRSDVIYKVSGNYSTNLNSIISHKSAILNEVNQKNTFNRLSLKSSVSLSSLFEIETFGITPKSIVKPRAYKTLNVKGVAQSGPTCWAATCAAMINYKKGKSLGWADVAQYIHGDTNYKKSGTWTDIKNAYNHWKLYPTQTGRISFSSVKTEIESGDPMHLGLIGHSVGLIGYEDWAGPDSYDKILILLEANGGVRKSVTLKSNGNFNYYLTGNDSWLKTRKF